MSFYNSAQFDAKLVVAQICATFFLSGLSLSLTQWLVHQLFGTPMTLRDLYDYHVLTLSTMEGVVSCSALVANGIVVGFVLSFVVERAKKCLDFAVTLFILHWLICTWYAGFPNNLLFYGVNILATIVAAVSGEWLCMRRELREISVNDFLAARTSPPPVSSSLATSNNSGNNSSTVPPRQTSSNPSTVSIPNRRSSQRPSSPLEDV